MLSSGDAHVKVLVVDDHPNAANMLARVISRLGSHVEVVSATNGLEALQHLEDGAVDVLITDMMMPKINGLELIEQLKKQPGGRSMLTFLITAYDMPGLEEATRRLGINDILIKPFDPERIVQIVSNALENRKATPRNCL
jgi:CheY-like chemotaxis protein